MRARQSLVALALLAVLPVGLVAGCDGRAPKNGAPESTTPATSTPPAPEPAQSTSAAASDPGPGPTSTSAPPSRRLRGVDLSHHQGRVDWARVAGHGIDFAYLKATEGTGFTDPAFVGNRAAAARHGLRVGGYHYFQLCSDGAAQADHFADVLEGSGRLTMPPAVDLELAGSCAAPPPREQLLVEVRAFLDALQERVGTRPVVYLYPELEERFSLAADLASYPQWVRRLGSRPPARAWTIWQYDDSGTVPGVAGGVDLDLARAQP